MGMSLPLEERTDFPATEPIHQTPSNRDDSMNIDAYFRHYHTQYPFLHEPTFRAQWARSFLGQGHLSEQAAFCALTADRVPSKLGLLQNAVLGLGAFCPFQPT